MSSNTGDGGDGGTTTTPSQSSTNLGYTDSNPSPQSILRPDLSYSQDFSVTGYTSDKVELVNVTSPLDQLETVSYQYRNIPDIYKGLSIDPGSYAPSRFGRSVAAVLKDVVSVTCECDDCHRMLLPVKVSTSITAPLSVYLTDDILQILLVRAFALWFPEGDAISKVGKLIRGSLKPANL